MSLSLFAKISQIFGRAATFKILVPIYWNFRNRASSAIYTRIWVTRSVLAIFPGVQNVALFTGTFVGHPRIFGASFGTFSTIFTRTWTARANALLSCSCCSLKQSWDDISRLEIGSIFAPIFFSTSKNVIVKGLNNILFWKELA